MFPFTTIDCKNLEKIWLDSTKNYSILHVFGCPYYAYINEGNLEPRVKKCLHLGYHDGGKV